MRRNVTIPRLVTWIWIIIVGAASVLFLLTPTRAIPPYSPTQGWRTSTPEEQGIDSTPLVAMLDDIQKKNQPIDGILIVRNGTLVLEAYRHPFQADQRHFMSSATKSITGTLIGIAIDKGLIDSVDHKLLDFFPDRTFANVDTQKQSITLRHVLSMSSGLDWPHNGLNEYLEPGMEASKDWVQFVLDRPMAAAPGSVFVYNSGGSHLLSAVIQKATGMSALDFAQKHLFAPLGITNVTWATDPQGINFGAANLAMSPRDMAKLGYLYL